MVFHSSSNHESSKQHQNKKTCNKIGKNKHVLCKAKPWEPIQGWHRSSCHGITHNGMSLYASPCSWHVVKCMKLWCMWQVTCNVVKLNDLAITKECVITLQHVNWFFI